MQKQVFFFSETMASTPFFLLLISSSVLLATGLQCLDGNNKGVDWYAAYNTPKLRNPKGFKFREGLAYFYLDVNTPQLSLEENPINNTDSPIFNTLQQIYKAGKSESIMYLMYNDEPAPSSSPPSNKCGHTKGVVAFDETSGFWLIHSCPKFPPKKSHGFEWVSFDYGQNMLCITFSRKELRNISKQLLYNEPEVYDWTLPEHFAQDFPDLSRVIKRGHPTGPPWFSVVNLTSRAGQTFTNFAKSHKFGADLYDSLIAPTLKSDLLVETWLRTSGTELNSNCTAPYKVYRVNYISLPGGVQFKESKDHSKWAVSADSSIRQSDSSPWLCIGDINRMVSQFHRGGGSTCFQNPSAWKSYNSAVAEYQKCRHDLKYLSELGN